MNISHFFFFFVLVLICRKTSFDGTGPVQLTLSDQSNIFKIIFKKEKD